MCCYQSGYKEEEEKMRQQQKSGEILSRWIEDNLFDARVCCYQLFMRQRITIVMNNYEKKLLDY